MLYFVHDASQTRLIAVSAERPADPHSYRSRHDFRSLGQAEAVAQAATEFSGDRYIATDAGPHCSPRYDVIKMHRVGDEVSYSFNGDSYPCGVIIKISPSLRVIATSEGRTFYRRFETGSWCHGRTWFLTRGHVYKQNPSF